VDEFTRHRIEVGQTPALAPFHRGSCVIAHLFQRPELLAQRKRRPMPQLIAFRALPRAQTPIDLSLRIEFHRDESEQSSPAFQYQYDPPAGQLRAS